MGFDMSRKHVDLRRIFRLGSHLDTDFPGLRPITAIDQLRYGTLPDILIRHEGDYHLLLGPTPTETSYHPGGVCLAAPSAWQGKASFLRFDAQRVPDSLEIDIAPAAVRDGHVFAVSYVLYCWNPEEKKYSPMNPLRPVQPGLADTSHFVF